MKEFKGVIIAEGLDDPTIINKFAVIFLSFTSSIASFSTPELERKIAITARV